MSVFFALVYISSVYLTFPFLDANNLNIPDVVMEDNAIRGMQDASNDLVSFANVSVRRSLSNI